VRTGTSIARIMSKKKDEFPEGERKFASMLDLLRLRKRTLKGFDPAKEPTKHKLNEFTKSPIRYVKRDNYQLAIYRGRHKLSRHPIHSYTFIEHRDEYDTRDGANRKILVPSDETTVIVIAKHYDKGNDIGRQLRLSQARPISTLGDTIKDNLGTVYSQDNEEEP